MHIDITGCIKTHRSNVSTSLSVMLGLWQTQRALPLLPFTAFLEELNTFKTLQDGTLAADGTGCFEAGMLGHDSYVFVKSLEKSFTPPDGRQAGSYNGSTSFWQEKFDTLQVNISFSGIFRVLIDPFLP